MTDALRVSEPHEPSPRGTEPEGPVAAAVTEFSTAVARKLGRGGSPEDQLRGPIEILLKRLATYIGLDAVAYGEVALKGLRARPDYAVDVGNARIGYVELKAPGRGVPPEWKPDRREREQWERLSALPNVLYSDGTSWGRYSFGEPAGPVVHLDGIIHDTQQPLHPIGPAFELLIRDFLSWEPERPHSLAELIKIVAGLCRLLRDEVRAILSGSPEHTAYEDLTLLAADWRDLLFPDLDDNGFADAYSQTIVYALLLARVDGITFQNTSLHEIARQLGKKHLLIGRAFSVLTDSDSAEELRTIETLRRVIGAVDWGKLDDGHTNVYTDLYEKFLAEYNPELRKQSGSYYTPQPVAGFLVDFVDQILRSRLDRSWGLASDDVIVVDPAMGTGTFLIEIVRSVADTVDDLQGRGARPERLRDLFARRLVGFELQVAPYAVAELRLHQALKTRFKTDLPPSEVRFLTNTLENPREQQQRFRAAYKIIERSREEANRIKREEPVMVIIGNPPHVENTKGKADWIERSRDPKLQPPSIRTRPSLDEFRAPELGRYESDLHGLPWLFWRWAIWKAFEAHPDDPTGIVAFVTPASLIKGIAFAGTREYLRRTCDEGWIIDLSPEGNRPKANTRVFGASVGRQLCIAVFARRSHADPRTPAVVHHVTLAGTRDQKIEELRDLRPDSSQWTTCRSAWQSAFLPEQDPEWDRHPALADLMPWRSRGITTGRNWTYAPDPEVLRRRWQTLIASNSGRRKILFRESRDRKLNSRVLPLPGFEATTQSLSTEYGTCPEPIRIGYRSFDRQWLIPDSRLMEMPRPPLWAVRSDQQIYVTAQDAHSINSGPGITLSSLIPDLHHFNGRDGGVRPLYRNAEGTIPNISPGLMGHLSRRLGIHVTAEDLLAYIAAVTAHAGYTARFRRDLRLPGIRVPLTADTELWTRAVSIGREIIWLHSFGERFADDRSGRPHGALALAERSGIRVATPITSSPTEIPDTLSHDPDSRVLRVGNGSISPVDQAVYEYDVDGMRIVRHWFDYRTKEPRHKKRTSPLDSINISQWTRQLTDELLAMLAAIAGCVSLEPQQLDLLSSICAGPTVSTTELNGARILPVAKSATRSPQLSDTYPATLDT
jgi:hypothetical protein